MASVSAVTYFVIGFIVIHASLLVWVRVLLPGTVSRARSRLEAAPLRSLFWGMAVFAASILFVCLLLAFRMRGIQYAAELLAKFSSSLDVNRLPNDAYVVTHVLGWMLLGPVMAAWIFGGAAFAEIFAERLGRQVGRDLPIAGFVAGAFCTSAGAFLPFVGWFVFLPLVGLMSIGAGAWALSPIRRPARTQEKIKSAEWSAATVHSATTPRTGDARSGDARSGDARTGDEQHADVRHGTAIAASAKRPLAETS